MKAIDAIRITLRFTDKATQMLEGMADVALLRPGPWGGNHAMWIAGHLCIAEGRLHQMINGGENPVAHWKPLFDWGSEPTDDATAYPPFAEVIATFKSLRAQTHAYLDKHGDEGLDTPTKSKPPGFDGFDTVGQAITIIAGHAIGHMGGMTVVRAAAGKQRYFVPSAALKAY